MSKNYAHTPRNKWWRVERRELTGYNGNRAEGEEIVKHSRNLMAFSLLSNTVSCILLTQLDRLHLIRQQRAFGKSTVA